MGFASKIAAAQSSSQPPNQSMASNQGTYGGAPPSGYTGGPPAALRPGGYVSDHQLRAWVRDVIWIGGEKREKEKRTDKELLNSNSNHQRHRSRNTRLTRDPLLQTRDR
ncbi:hypothetical protein N7468_010029 [Penicillium chermesinum]|uniref:Uncharacterized protein n=1 Tax=Penicillium chermesinum TaxID=63820 RepID=A0A9W9NBX7_9EURO|nr:uncharacterized protein N7468_010029 [Penicillium chermesinum]KAJ5217021.1 hypothetical protein N7468_010029 [Penicillium chermesinum]KAJ6171367.1 hypothetical protein N7470_000434 [Penicillium chermesinum]